MTLPTGSNVLSPADYNERKQKKLFHSKYSQVSLAVWGSLVTYIH